MPGCADVDKQAASAHPSSRRFRWTYRLMRIRLSLDGSAARSSSTAREMLAESRFRGPPPTRLLKCHPREAPATPSAGHLRKHELRSAKIHPRFYATQIRTLHSAQKENAAHFRAAFSSIAKTEISCLFWTRSAFRRMTSTRRTPTPGRRRRPAYVPASACPQSASLQAPPQAIQTRS